MRRLYLYTFLIVLLLVGTTSATNYLNLYVTHTVQPGDNIIVQGQITNTTPANITNINVSANVTSSADGGSGFNLTAFSDTSTSVFKFNITAPSAAGDYNVSVVTNDSTLPNKTIPIYVGNSTGGSVTYLTTKPPFSPGNTIELNLTLLDVTTPIADYYPNVSIYVANGKEASGWTIANSSALTDALGVIQYNITVPATASAGQYALVVDKGAFVQIINIRSGFITSVITHTPGKDDESSANFAPGNNVTILAKVLTTDGVSTAASNVTAYVTLPNSTIRTVPLTARNQTAYLGFFNSTFNETSASGTYKIKVVVYKNNTYIEGNSLFYTKKFNVNMEPQSDFFMEWGGTAAFAAGETVSLDILVTNLTDDSFFTVGTDQVANRLPACNSSYLNLWNVFYANGSSINSSVSGATFTTGRYLMNQICRVQFTASSDSGTYGIKLNVTRGGTTETGTKYFYVQKYFLKASVSLGGGMDFMPMISPGENVTIVLSGYNVTNEKDLTGPNITNGVVEKITPLHFMTGITEITSNINYSFTGAGTQLDDPSVEVNVPSSVLGPALIQVKATVGGETIRGSAFIMSNYLMGFIQPQTGGQGMPFSACEGTQTFSGMAREVKSNSAAQGVVIEGTLHEAKEESTGKDMKSCLTVGNGTSNSQGTVSVNVTFSSSCSYSGFYFMAINATYKGKTTAMPAGFMCKSLNFFPKIKSSTGDDTWRIAPNSSVNVIIEGVTRLNDSRNISNSTITFPKLMNFNPGKGGMSILTPLEPLKSNVPIFINYTNSTGGISNVTYNMFNVTIYPYNFTSDGSTPLSKWPNGFIDMQPQICTESLDGTGYPWASGCDTGFGGFMVSPFDAWIQSFGWGGNTQVNSTASYIIRAKTNVSINCTSSTDCNRNITTSMVFTGTNNTGFKVKIGRPWEGSLADAENVLVRFVADEWNSTTDSMEEQWNVSFDIPANTPKGETMLIMNVNNSYGESMDVEVFTTITKYTVKIPTDEGIWLGNAYCMPNAPAASTYDCLNHSWDLTAINAGIGILNGSTSPVFYINDFNVTRYGTSQQSLTYNTSIGLMIIDTLTGGNGYVLVVNASGNLSYVNNSNRQFTSDMPNSNKLYLKTIESDSYAIIFNISALPDSNNYGGSAQKSSFITIPYVVKLGATPMTGMNLTASSIIRQTDQGTHGSASGAFGFEEQLKENRNYTYVQGLTDSQGVAFLRVNITGSGRFNIFWRVNDSANDDTATMSTGSNIVVKAFDAYASVVNELAQGSVTLIYNTTGWGIGGGNVYNRSVNETGVNTFISDGSSNTWYIAYNVTSNFTYLDTDVDVSDGSNGNWSSTISISGTSIKVGVGAFRNTSSGSNYRMAFSFYQDSPTGAMPSIQENSTYKNNTFNVTAYVCAKDFTRPTANPIENAVVKIYTEQFTAMGPPTKRYLTMYDPINGSAVSSTGTTVPAGIKTGPNGCVGFNVYYDNGWPTGTQVQGIVTDPSGNEEMIWIGWVGTTWI